MKKVVLFTAILLCAATTAFSATEGKTFAEPDYSGLTSQNHPRVIYTDADFAAIKEAVAYGANPYLNEIDKMIISRAESMLNEPDFERKMVGRRLPVAGAPAISRLLYCAYAYKMTGNPEFLEKVDRDMKSVCSFEDWNAVQSFLNAAAMCIGLGLAYDWLYNDLTDETKAIVRKGLYDFAFHPALYEYETLKHDFYNYKSNFNSVCNAGLVCAALATYEDNPDVSQALIDKALETNVEPVKVCYSSPYGNYAEGYGYWNYGTDYQVLLLTALQTALGSDNGLSDIEGFSKTAKYVMFMEGPSGQCFNFSDGSGTKTIACPALWYFAWRFCDTSILYSERSKLTLYKGIRFLPVTAWYASKVDNLNIEAPRDHIFHGEGLTPIVLVHDTWTMDEDDMFLAAKAGTAKTNHGHMDAGSFVFDAEGLRWASDLGGDDYTTLESYLKMGLWSMKDDSVRWDVFRYNNFNHNTLTVNGKYHRVAGVSKILEVIDSDGRRGAVIDISEPLDGELASAVRTIYIEGKDLLVEDRITALESKSAEVRWTLVTPGEPSIGSDGITLIQAGKSRRLIYSSTTGHEVEWHTWSTQSENEWDAPNPGMYECGYTVTLNPGDTAVIMVRLIP